LNFAHAVLDRLFGTAEEINGAERCSTYLYRWVIGHVGPVKIYLHHFVGDDWSFDLHDHPKRFVTVGLKGRYLERSDEGERTYAAPWLRTFPSSHRHRITMFWRLRDERGFAVRDGQEDCWTLVLVGPTQREWGFWHKGQFVHFKTYVRGPLGDLMKACS
jgi:hypothetical protein